MNDEELRVRMLEDVKAYADNVTDMYNAPFARMMGMEVVSISTDECVCKTEICPGHMNSMGRGHGTVIHALVDHTFAILCNPKHPCTGQSTTIKHYRPAQGRLKVVCRPVNRFRSLEIYEVCVFSEKGKLVVSVVNTAFVLKG